MDEYDIDLFFDIFERDYMYFRFGDLDKELKELYIKSEPFKEFLKNRTKGSEYFKLIKRDGGNIPFLNYNSPIVLYLISFRSLTKTSLRSIISRIFLSLIHHNFEKIEILKKTFEKYSYNKGEDKVEDKSFVKFLLNPVDTIFVTNLNKNILNVLAVQYQAVEKNESYLPIYLLTILCYFNIKPTSLLPNSVVRNFINNGKVVEKELTDVMTKEIFEKEISKQNNISGVTSVYSFVYDGSFFFNMYDRIKAKHYDYIKKDEQTTLVNYNEVIEMSKIIFTPDDFKISRKIYELEIQKKNIRTKVQSLDQFLDYEEISELEGEIKPLQLNIENKQKEILKTISSEQRENISEILELNNVFNLITEIFGENFVYSKTNGRLKQENDYIANGSNSCQLFNTIERFHPVDNNFKKLGEAKKDEKKIDKNFRDGYALKCKIGDIDFFISNSAKDTVKTCVLFTQELYEGQEYYYDILGMLYWYPGTQPMDIEHIFAYELQRMYLFKYLTTKDETCRKIIGELINFFLNVKYSQVYASNTTNRAVGDNDRHQNELDIYKNVLQYIVKKKHDGDKYCEDVYENSFTLMKDNLNKVHIIGKKIAIDNFSHNLNINSIGQNPVKLRELKTSNETAINSMMSKFGTDNNYVNFKKTFGIYELQKQFIINNEGLLNQNDFLKIIVRDLKEKSDKDIIKLYGRQKPSNYNSSKEFMNDLSSALVGINEQLKILINEFFLREKHNGIVYRLFNLNNTKNKILDKLDDIQKLEKNNSKIEVYLINLRRADGGQNGGSNIDLTPVKRNLERYYDNNESPIQKTVEEKTDRTREKIFESMEKNKLDINPEVSVPWSYFYMEEAESICGCNNDEITTHFNNIYKKENEFYDYDLVTTVDFEEVTHDQPKDLSRLLKRKVAQKSKEYDIFEDVGMIDKIVKQVGGRRKGGKVNKRNGFFNIFGSNQEKDDQIEIEIENERNKMENEFKVNINLLSYNSDDTGQVFKLKNTYESKLVTSLFRFFESHILNQINTNVNENVNENVINFYRNPNMIMSYILGKKRREKEIQMDEFLDKYFIVKSQIESHSFSNFGFIQNISKLLGINQDDFEPNYEYMFDDEFIKSCLMEDERMNDYTMVLRNGEKSIVGKGEYYFYDRIDEFEDDIFKKAVKHVLRIVSYSKLKNFKRIIYQTYMFYKIENEFVDENIQSNIRYRIPNSNDYPSLIGLSMDDFNSFDKLFVDEQLIEPEQFNGLINNYLNSQPILPESKYKQDLNSLKITDLFDLEMKFETEEQEIKNEMPNQQSVEQPVERPVEQPVEQPIDFGKQQFDLESSFIRQSPLAPVYGGLRRKKTLKRNH